MKYKKTKPDDTINPRMSVPRVKSGLLLAAGDFCNQYGTPKMGAPSTPVLTAGCIVERFRRAASGPSCFSFGQIIGPDSLVMTIRQQVGSVQTYWLADTGDASLWEAIDCWRLNRIVPVAMLGQGSLAYCVHELIETPRSMSAVDALRRQCGKSSAAAFLDFTLELAASGILEQQATSDIDGVRLSHVDVNVLMTERLVQSAMQSAVEASPTPVSAANISAKFH